MITFVMHFDIATHHKLHHQSLITSMHIAQTTENAQARVSECVGFNVPLDT